MNPIDDRTYKALLDDGITAQGDLIIVRDDLIEGAIDSETIDSSWEQVISTTETHVVAHSETGHHHILRIRSSSPDQSARKNAMLWRNPSAENPEIVSLTRIADGDIGEIVHMRDTHVHETHYLPPGAWYLRRQQRPTPEGWEVVAD
jgi:hypothetical protein